MSIKPGDKVKVIRNVDMTKEKGMKIGWVVRNRGGSCLVHFVNNGKGHTGNSDDEAAVRKSLEKHGGHRDSFYNIPETHLKRIGLVKVEL
jgi:hypothetical protein